MKNEYFRYISTKTKICLEYVKLKSSSLQGTCTPETAGQKMTTANHSRWQLFIKNIPQWDT